LAREFAPFGITVNTVAPAGVDTPRMRSGIRLGSPDLSTRAAALNPSERRAEVEEVAALVGFVTLPIAGYITGQVISINGGSSML
jgi:2,3-dihydroxy-2,3-dihydro-p-cumate dehydrogenase